MVLETPDYWGVSTELQEALAIFSPSDIKGALMPKHNESLRLQARHAAAMRFFGEGQGPAPGESDCRVRDSLIASFRKRAHERLGSRVQVWG